MAVSAEYASKNYVKYTYPNAFFQFMLAKFQADFLSFLNQANPASVLEVGSGEGFLLNHAAARRTDSAFTGVDLSAQALRYALGHCWPGVSLVQADVGRLPFRSKSFDLIMCSEVLEHLADLEAAVAEIKRVARRHVLISVPLEPYFQWAASAVARLHLAEDPDHVRFWSKKDFRQFVQRKFHPVAFKQSALYQIALCEVTTSA